MTDPETTEKLNAIMKILQDFGLNVIQHLGQTKKAITVLTDKVDSLASATIELKSLGNRLSEVIRANDRISEDLATIKKLVQQQAVSPNIQKSSNVGRLAEGSRVEDPIFSRVVSIVQSAQTLVDIQDALSHLQETLYEERGPSALLSEIRKVISKLKFEEGLTDALRQKILEKLNSWENRAL